MKVSSAWRWLQRSLFVLPLWPAVGTVGLGWSALQQSFRTPGRAAGSADRRWLRWGFGTWAAATIVSCLLAEHPVEAWLGLANFLPFLGFYLAIAKMLGAPERLYRLAQLWVGSAIAVALLGLGQILAGWQTPPGWEYALGWALLPGGNPPGRLASTFLYANTCGAFLGLSWILGLGLGVLAWQQWRRDRRCWQSLLGLAAGLAAIGVALIFTSSRAVWGVAGLAVLAYGGYLGWTWLLGSAGLGAGAILWAAFGVPPTQQWLQQIVPAFVWARLNDSLYPDRPTPDLRATQWQFCWQLIGDRPWQGWGLRNFTPLYEAAYPGTWLGHPHNLFLMLAAETGLPAMILLVGTVGCVVARASRYLLVGSPTTGADRTILFAYLAAFGGCVLLNLPDVTIFELRNNLLGWLLLAAIDGATQAPDGARNERPG